MGGYAWVTLATNDAYSLGALVLAHSLRRVGTKHDLAVLVTPGVTQIMREKLAAVFSLVQEVNVLDSKDEANLALLARPELGITFTKLHCWRLTQYEKCVFVDADTLVVRNCDELFEREELSAAPDVGWPDCFNSGVFVYRPSQQTFASITAFAAAKGSFDGGDQGLLNMYFNDWSRKDISKHLPFIYNMCSTAAYSYLPAFKQFGEDVRIIHFIGITKPWLQYFDTLTGIVQPPVGSTHLQPLLQLWWNIFCEKVHPQLSPVMAGLAGALAQMTLGEPRSAEQIALEEHMRKQSWEQGQIDYMGRDSFDNIWKKICETLALTPQQPSLPKDEQQIEESSTNVATLVADEPDITPANAAIDMTEEQFLTCKIPIKENLTEETRTNEEKLRLLDTSSKSEIIPTQTLEEKIPDSRENEEFNLSQKVSPKIIGQTSTEATTEIPAVETVLGKPLTVVEEKKISQDTNLQTTLENVEVPTSIQQIAEQTPVNILGEEVALQQVPMVPTSCLMPEKASSQIVSDTSNTQDISKEVTTEKQCTECPLRIPKKPDEIDQTAIPVEKESDLTKSSSSLKETENIDTPTTSQCIDETIAKAVSDLNVMEDIIKSSSIRDEQHAEMLSAASEILTTSPVPIQVAESVLQAEPKESISEDLKTMTEGVISSKVTPIHESSSVSIEPLIGNRTELNRGTFSTEKSSSKKVQDINYPLLKESEIVQPSQSQMESKEPIAEVKPAISEMLSTEIAAKKLKESAQLEQIVAGASCSLASDILTPTEIQKSPQITIPESSEVESPIRPTRTKELNIPPTPTVTEATPPTSPPIDPAQDLETQGKTVKKAQKKTIKKTASESDTAEGGESESTEKKSKKVVKKPGKKPKDSQDEGSEASSVADKPKKTGKTTKKVTKSTHTLGADTSIPDTPPPGTSDAPVPPKRKVKTSAAAKPTAAKKPDTEE